MAIAKLVHLSVVGGLSGDDLERPTLVHLEFPGGLDAIISYNDATLL